MPSIPLPLLTVEDALARVITWMRNPGGPPYAADRETVASELDLRRMLDAVITEEIARAPAATSYTHDIDTNVRPFHAAVWELCRRGVLVPRVLLLRERANRYDEPPPYGWFYDVTPYGRQWLAAADAHPTLPAAYTRYADLLAGHGARFGDGYRTRSREAARCYQAQTYLATCVMCGAAAESILLALAVARSGDEARILRDYQTGGGRSRIERFVVGQQPEAVQKAFGTYTELLQNWRDDAAHGTAVDFDEEAAHTALILLLRFAQFAEARWDALTTRRGAAGEGAVT